MNDRFKFRVWLEYAKLYYGLDSFYYDRLKNKYTLHFEDGHTKTIKEKDCVIEQCTGLKDKNGKLIYEGDILGYKDYADKRVVVWDNKYMAYRVHDEDNVDCGSVYQEYIGEFGIEVIGNIHENPELLKESK